jgi:hypothetical protein
MTTTASTFTREELLAAATARGFRASARLISDWVELGLLDRPTRRGLGRGRGSLATWPENQVQLFLQLLDQRSKGARRVPTLCNLPVGLWLHFGDDYAPPRQVRRALSTWAAKGTAGTYGSGRAAEQSASDIIGWLSGGAVTSVEHEALARALGLITYQIATAQRYEHSDLIDVVSRAIAAANPSVPATDLAEGFARGLASRVKAISRLSTIPDEVFVAARANVAMAELEYAVRQPQLAGQPVVGHVYDARDWNQRFNHACSNLLTHLGYLLLANEATDQSNAEGTPATAATARGHGTGTLEVPDAPPP